jgi:hypothetical protein
VTCAGCSAWTAARTTKAFPGWVIPTGWAICGLTPAGEIAAWCPSCQAEGKHERAAAPSRDGDEKERRR